MSNDIVEVLGSELVAPRYLVFGRRQGKIGQLANGLKTNIGSKWIGPLFKIYALDAPSKEFYQDFAELHDRKKMIPDLEFYRMVDIEGESAVLRKLETKVIEYKPEEGLSLIRKDWSSKDPEVLKIYKWIVERNLLVQGDGPKALVSEEEAIRYFNQNRAFTMDVLSSNYFTKAN